MQAGGKIEDGESAMATLRREIREELGCAFVEPVTHLGTFTAPAANEPDRMVMAEVYRVQLESEPAISSEIEEMIWASEQDVEILLLAPLTKDHVVPIWRAGN